MTKKSIYFGVFVLFIITIISCEKDFEDVTSDVITNTKFDINEITLDVVITNKELKSVRADGLSIGGNLGQYLFGVYNNPNYEKIEASIISQLSLNTSVNNIKTYGADTTVVTTVDTAFVRLPYQATLKTGTTSEYTLDSIIGDKSKSFTVNVYQSETFLSQLNPVDPSKLNSYLSDDSYQIIPNELNAELNYQFSPNSRDTLLVYKRRNSLGEHYKTDSISLPNNVPFGRIPLDKDKIKQIFVDQFGTDDFKSQAAFNTYFKGLFIQASGNEGALVGIKIGGTNARLVPSLEIIYTETIIVGGAIVVDEIEKSASFPLSNFSTSQYKMSDRVYPADKNIVIQGTAGSTAQIKIFGEDNDNNGIADKIEELRKEKWLINDASLTFYVNQDIVGTDTITAPYRLYLYKEGANNMKYQIKDALTEQSVVYGGNLELSSDDRPNKYNFRITNYISDLLSGASDYNPVLGLKVYNTTDSPVSPIDSIIPDYSWNPKVVTLLNHSNANGARKARLKISYSIKK